MAEPSYWELLEPYWSKLGEYNSAADWFAVMDAFPRPIILLYAAHFSQSEICNGGLFQLFWNSSGVFAPEAIEGYQVVGMPLLADVLQTAVSTLGPKYPRERQERWEALRIASQRSPEEIETIRKNATHPSSAARQESQPPNFDGLDRRFFALIRTEAGGFDVAATAYALAVEPTLVWPSSSPNHAVRE